MLKTEFLNFLRDADICKEIFEIIRRSGKPTNSEIPAAARQFPNKVEFLNFLHDAEVCKMIFEIILRGGKPPAPIEIPNTPPKTEVAGGATNRIVALREQIRNRLTNKTPPPSERKSTLGSRLELMKQKAALAAAEKSISPITTDEPAGGKLTFVAERNCPVCGSRTKVVLVRTRLVAETLDSDFCMHYKNFNPYLYGVCVCEHCGYVADDEHFQERMPERIRKAIKPFLDENNFKTPFTEERDKDEALMLFEMAIYFNEMFERSLGRQALMYQKMAWICRIEKDAEKEKDFLLKCAEKFEQSLNNERYPIGKVTDDMATYIVGINYYTLGDFDKATKYIGQLISSNQVRITSPKLYEKARDTWQDLRQIRATRK
ncbi:MAG: DUF2225 domain-containing protein [Selenomonadaceae bacterium]|nr:DUF2225 domain-containing protein [Selenomonadaceae bacterium]